VKREVIPYVHFSRFPFEGVEDFMVPTSYYIALSAVLFILGALGVLIRRHAILIFMSVELMLNAANLAFVAFARAYESINGQVFVFFVITVAAAEVAVGLALMVAIFHSKQSIDVDELSSLKG
jgi:NADH-quinone oxidoreductase subunit K